MPIQNALDSISQNAGSPFGFKNRVINGAMTIDQRNNGTTVTSIGNGGYSVDRFVHYHTIATINSGRNLNSVTPPPGFKNYLGLQVSSPASSIGSGDYCNIQHWIEGYNVNDLQWGTSTAKAVTLSFWVYTSLVGTYGVYVMAGSGNPDNTYCSQFTVSSANTWQYVTIVVPGLTNSTGMSTTNGRAIGIGFDLGNGSTYRNGTLNTWVASAVAGTPQGLSGTTNWCSTNGATFYVTGVQLEVGRQATAYDYRPYTTELQLCQRYCYIAGTLTGGYTISIGVGYSATGTNIWRCNILLPVALRTTPSISETNMIVWNPAAGATDVNSIATIYYLDNQIYLEMDLTTTSNHGIGYGYPALLETKGSGGKAIMEVSAEL